MRGDDRPLWRRPLPRSWNIAVTLVVLAIALMLAANAPRLHIYMKYFGGRSPQVVMDYDQLSSDMNEAAVQAHFAPLSLRCSDESGNLGERVCFAALDKADGLPALTLALFFKRGRLAHAFIHVPWWAHHRMAGQLMKRLGVPEAINLDPVAGNRLVQWRVKHGLVEINRDPGWNPLAWSAVYWTAPVD